MKNIKIGVILFLFATSGFTVKNQNGLNYTSVNAFDNQGKINGKWQIFKNYKGTIHSGTKAIMEFQAQHGILDSTYKVYSKRDNILLEEGKLIPNSKVISGGVESMDSVKNEILKVTNRTIYTKYYRKNGFPFDEKLILDNTSYQYTYWYKNSNNKYSIHFFSKQYDSTVYFTQSGKVSGYLLMKDTIQIETKYINNY